MSAKVAIAAAGLVLNLIGALALARGLFMSAKQAIEIGVSRFAADSDEENVKLPAVRDRIISRNWAVGGAISLVIGFAFQLWAVFI
jgi:hypothetical protein